LLKKYLFNITGHINAFCINDRFQYLINVTNGRKSNKPSLNYFLVHKKKNHIFHRIYKNQTLRQNFYY